MNYPAYFKCLEDLYTIVAHKIKLNKNKKDSKESYETLKKTFFDISSKNRDAYLGTSQSSEKVLEVENSLREIERYLYSVMDKANMFGSMRDDSGL